MIIRRDRWLLVLELPHQLCKVTVRLHQVGIRHDEAVGKVERAVKEVTAEYPIGVVNGVTQLNGEVVYTANMPINGRDVTQKRWAVGISNAHLRGI